MLVMNYTNVLIIIGLFVIVFYFYRSRQETFWGNRYINEDFFRLVYETYELGVKHDKGNSKFRKLGNKMKEAFNIVCLLEDSQEDYFDVPKCKSLFDSRTAHRKELFYDKFSS